MDEHTVTMHTVTMHLSNKSDPAHVYRYDADGGSQIVDTLYLSKSVAAGNLVEAAGDDFGKAPQRIRVTMIIEALER
jgi:hypothetical protein